MIHEYASCYTVTPSNIGLKMLILLDAEMSAVKWAIDVRIHLL